MADTDGDGMPDGYEAWMCQSLNYFNKDTFTYDCLSSIRSMPQMRL